MIYLRDGHRASLSLSLVSVQLHWTSIGPSFVDLDLAKLHVAAEHPAL